MRIQRSSFVFNVSGPKKKGKVVVTASFHPNAESLIMRKVTTRAARLSGDRNPRFVKALRIPLAARG